MSQDVLNLLFIFYLNLFGFYIILESFKFQSGGLSGESKSYKIVGHAWRHVTQFDDNRTRHHERTFLCHSPMLKSTR